MHYDTLSQEFNEYHLDDGTKIKIFTNVTTISRTTLKDPKVTQSIISNQLILLK